MTNTINTDMRSLLADRRDASRAAADRRAAVNAARDAAAFRAGHRGPVADLGAAFAVRS